MHDTDPDHRNDNDAANTCGREKSKSQLKREAHALQALGEALLVHPPASLRAAGLPDTLYDAVTKAQGIHQRSARKRQLQFIGKLMRGLNPVLIQATLDRLLAPDRAEAASLHRLENWRERLIEEGDPGVSALLEGHPYLDRQHLRRLVRDARNERQEPARPTRHARALFRYLRDTIQE